MAKERDQRSDDVLDVAARIIRRKGFAAATVREIAAAAGMLPGSLHYRYPSKERLLIALMERATTTVLRTVREAVAASSDPLERVRLALRAHLCLVLSHEDTFHVLQYNWWSLLPDDRQEILRLRRLYQTYWDGLLYAVEAAGAVTRPADLKLLRLFGLAALNAVPQWFRRDGALSPEEIADQLWHLMMSGLGAERGRGAT